MLINARKVFYHWSIALYLQLEILLRWVFANFSRQNLNLRLLISVSGKPVTPGFWHGPFENLTNIDDCRLCNSNVLELGLLGIPDMSPLWENTFWSKIRGPVLSSEQTHVGSTIRVGGEGTIVQETRDRLSNKDWDKFIAHGGLKD